MKKAKRGRAKPKAVRLRMVKQPNGFWQSKIVGQAESDKFDLDHGVQARMLDLVAVWAVREQVEVSTAAMKRLADRASALLQEVSDSAFALGQREVAERAGERRDKRGRRIGKRAHKSPAAVAA
jgi:hypothetical protein